MSIFLRSPSFEDKGIIPSKHAYDREDVSPAIQWENLPEGTKSIALICEDPDAPMGDWIHWIVFNIPPTKKGLEEDIPKVEGLSDGTKQGKNDYGKIGYGGPCPPFGTHRYIFKVYALDAKLDLKPGCTKAELLKAMRPHIIDQGEITGLYSRK